MVERLRTSADPQEAQEQQRQQEGEEDDLPLLEEEEPAELRSSGVALVNAAGRRFDVPYTLTDRGPLFALAPIASALGGSVGSGPGGAGVVFQVADRRYVLGAESNRVVSGGEILSLSQRPVMGEGGIQVPLDLLRRSFGELEGYDFLWEPDIQRLSIGRSRRAELRVEVDTVHIQGTTTVVLLFPDGAPRYEIRDSYRGVEVEIQGSRLAVDGRMNHIDPEDPLVRRIEILPERIRIELEPDMAAESYVLREPFRLVFDVREEVFEVETEAKAPAVEPPAPRSGLRTIILDPGHGGTESGAVGASGTLEKDLTLSLAQDLARRLESRLGDVRVVLTRTEDANLPLTTRSAIANENKGDLFVSIHLNSYRGGTATGAETYFLSHTASDSAAAAAAEWENTAGRPTAEGDPLADLQLILWDLAQTRYLAESQRLANLIQEELNTTLGLRDRGVKQAPFTVLVGAAMPAVLVELGFLSNPEEEAKLRSPGHRGQLVEAVAKAIVRYRDLVEADLRPAEGNGADGNEAGGDETGAETGGGTDR